MSPSRFSDYYNYYNLMNPLFGTLSIFYSFTSRGLLSTQFLLGLFISISIIHKVSFAQKFSFPLSLPIQQVSPCCFLQLPPLSLVLCIFGYCPCAGLFAVANFVPLLESRCCHCLAGLRFGCFLRFLRCLRFAKPRYTERTLRRVQFHVSHVSLFARYNLLEGLPRKYISSFALDFLMEPLALHNWP